MNTNKTMKLAVALLVGGTTLAAAPALLAGPALSGLVAQADNAESAMSSPAGMSRLHGTHMSVQAIIASPQSNFDVDESKTDFDGGNPNLGRDPIVIPALYYVRQLNDRWHGGVSLSVPSGFGSDYGGEWAGRYESVDFTLVYVALTPAVSYRVNDHLSLGSSLAINYTSSTSEVKIEQPLGDSDNDAKISSDLDGIGTSITLSVLYEFNDRTRAGIAWTSDAEADMDGNVRTRNLAPASDQLFSDLGLKDINTEITNTLPQRVLAGVYHEFESGKYFTIDGLWMKFSDFSVTDIKLEGQDVGVNAPLIFNDIWALTAGMGFPVNERLTYSVGAMYLSQPVDDEDRPLTMALDEMWGVGVGLTYKLAEDRSLDLNANYINIGKSPVDTGESDSGRLAGENDDPYALMVELTYHF